MTRNRALALGGLAAGVVYGLFGGEYTFLDWIEIRRRVATERASIARLQAENDSLRRLADALEQDPVTQEREARERFGMLRPGETIYRIIPDRAPDSAPGAR